jgi:hypothetical protein
LGFELSVQKTIGKKTLITHANLWQCAPQNVTNFCSGNDTTCKSQEVICLSCFLSQPLLLLGPVNSHLSHYFQAWPDAYRCILRQIKVTFLSAETILDGFLSKVCIHLLSLQSRAYSVQFWTAYSWSHVGKLEQFRK